jgi:hypothetical protein
MAGFLFRLETEDGKPADPPTLHAVPPPLVLCWAERDVADVDARDRCVCTKAQLRALCPFLA